MKAGWCGACGAYVWLAPDGSCQHGHPAGYVSNAYETDVPAAPVPEVQQPAPAFAPVAEAPAPAPQPAPAPAAAAAPAPQPAPAEPAPSPAPEAAQPAYGSKEAVVSAVWYALAPYPQLTVTRTQKADVEIAANLADASWGVGKKKVDFSAVMRADEAERTVFYWEMVKEEGAGMTPGFGFQSESYSTFGGKRSGKTKEFVAVPGQGAVVDYEWDYAATRKLVEEAVRSQGWAFKVVLRKGKATY